MPVSRRLGLVLAAVWLLAGVGSAPALARGVVVAKFTDRTGKRLGAKAKQALKIGMRQDVLARARTHADAVLALAPDWSAPYDIRAIGDDRFDRLSDALATLPCPLLDQEGRCTIYDARPAVCRLMGLALINEHDDVIDNSCPIQDDFPTYRDLAPQFFALDAWEDSEASCRAAAAVQLTADAEAAGYETTIAMALMAWPIEPRHP